MRIKKSNLIRIICLAIGLSYLLSPIVSQASNPYGSAEGATRYSNELQAAREPYGLEQTAVNAGITASQKANLPSLLGRLINYSFGLLGVIMMCVALLGGFIWMTAGGNEEKLAKGKHFIANGINGLIVMFMAYALVYVVLAALQAATG